MFIQRLLLGLLAAQALSLSFQLSAQGETTSAALKRNTNREDWKGTSLEVETARPFKEQEPFETRLEAEANYAVGRTYHLGAVSGFTHAWTQYEDSDRNFHLNDFKLKLEDWDFLPGRPLGIHSTSEAGIRLPMSKRSRTDSLKGAYDWLVSAHRPFMLADYSFGFLAQNIITFYDYRFQTNWEGTAFNRLWAAAQVLEPYYRPFEPLRVGVFGSFETYRDYSFETRNTYGVGARAVYNVWQGLSAQVSIGTADALYTNRTFFHERTSEVAFKLEYQL